MGLIPITQSQSPFFAILVILAGTILACSLLSATGSSTLSLYQSAYLFSKLPLPYPIYCPIRFLLDNLPTPSYNQFIHINTKVYIMDGRANDGIEYYFLPPLVIDLASLYLSFPKTDSDAHCCVVGASNHQSIHPKPVGARRCVATRRYGIDD